MLCGGCKSGLGGIGAVAGGRPGSGGIGAVPCGLISLSNEGLGIFPGFLVPDGGSAKMDSGKYPSALSVASSS